MNKWLLYGANGYSGFLILEKALNKGIKPVIAGRNEAKIRTIAERYELEYEVFALDESSKVRKSVSEVSLVLNCAGPFIYTAEPFLKACLEAGTHYLDITGEIPVFQKVFSYHKKAEQKGVLLLSGAGFDVVPSDCLAVFLKDKSNFTPLHLELGIFGLNRISRGTARTMLKMFPQGSMVRREGKLVRIPFGNEIKEIPIPHKKVMGIPIAWGDLETAWRSTGVPNITTYIGYPSSLAKIIKYSGKVLQSILRIGVLQKVSDSIISAIVKGPTTAYQKKSRVYLWGRITGEGGESKEAWLELPETYMITAEFALKCVEKTFEIKPCGALTPAMAFGYNLIKEIEGIRRFGWN